MKYEILKPTIVQKESKQVGDIVEITDEHVSANLLMAGQIAPASESKAKADRSIGLKKSNSKLKNSK